MIGGRKVNIHDIQDADHKEDNARPDRESTNQKRNNNHQNDEEANHEPGVALVLIDLFVEHEYFVPSWPQFILEIYHAEGIGILLANFLLFTAQFVVFT